MEAYTDWLYCHSLPTDTGPTLVTLARLTILNCSHLHRN